MWADGMALPWIHGSPGWLGSRDEGSLAGDAPRDRLRAGWRSSQFRRSAGGPWSMAAKSGGPARYRRTLPPIHHPVCAAQFHVLRRRRRPPSHRCCKKSRLDARVSGEANAPRRGQHRRGHCRGAPGFHHNRPRPPPTRRDSRRNGHAPPESLAAPKRTRCGGVQIQEITRHLAGARSIGRGHIGPGALAIGGGQPDERDPHSVQVLQQSHALSAGAVKMKPSTCRCKAISTIPHASVGCIRSHGCMRVV